MKNIKNIVCLLIILLSGCFQKSLPYPSTKSGVIFRKPVISHQEYMNFALGGDLPKYFVHANLIDDSLICKVAVFDNKWSQNDPEWVKEAKLRGLDCGIKNKNISTIVSEYVKPIKPISSPDPTYEYKHDSANGVNKNQKKEIKLNIPKVILKDKKTKKGFINFLNISTEILKKEVIVSGLINTNKKIVEFLINNNKVGLNVENEFIYKLYIPPSGLNLNLKAFTIEGTIASKKIFIKRAKYKDKTKKIFEKLNPIINNVKNLKNVVALIIGVEKYKHISGSAFYADKDAIMFKEYAMEKLGVPENKIKILLNNNADLGEIGLAVQEWLARSTQRGKTDIFIYFAGHGLASDNGKDMYLLPYDGRPRLLAKTAIVRDELFKEIQQTNPRSVTVFLDTCYSGTTRGTDMLIASRPIAIRALKQSIPNNFTVFSAAAGDQTSKPLEEAKHGMFSYFLMKGMEGDADSNNDNKITAGELHNYVKENVTQQSSGSQTPELQGDKDRVLVQFNQ